MINTQTAPLLTHILEGNRWYPPVNPLHTANIDVRPFCTVIPNTIFTDEEQQRNVRIPCMLIPGTQENEPERQDS